MTIKQNCRHAMTCRQHSFLQIFANIANPSNNLYLLSVNFLQKKKERQPDMQNQSKSTPHGSACKTKHHYSPQNAEKSIAYTISNTMSGSTNHYGTFDEPQQISGHKHRGSKKRHRNTKSKII